MLRWKNASGGVKARRLAVSAANPDNIVGHRCAQPIPAIVRHEEGDFSIT